MDDLSGGFFDQVTGLFFRILKEDDFPSVKNVVKDVYIPGEPLGRICGASEADLEDFFLPGLRLWTKSGFSVAAQEPASGRFVGVVLTSPLEGAEISTFSLLRHSGAPSVSLLLKATAVLDDVNLFENPTSESCAEMIILAVDKEYNGRGIGRKLIQCSEMALRTKGVQKVAIQATHVATRNICRRLAYDCVLSYDFGSFEVDGKRLPHVAREKPFLAGEVFTKLL